MIELPLRELPSYLRWFPSGTAGPTSLAEHVLATRTGRLWADRADRPRTVAITCAGHVLLSGDPGALQPGALAPLANRYVLAPARFLPALGSAFDRVVPWERMVYVHAEAPARPRPPRGVTVRRVVEADATALAVLGADSAWIQASWGGPARLAGSGHAWGAFHRGRLLAVACTYFLGSRYEDIAVVTVPEHRREQLALSCVVALCAGVEARGRTTSWTCSRYNRPSRLLAWTAGFRLEREYVHYATGTPTTKGVSGSRKPAAPVGGVSGA
ncbi:GNAT family N-acetyltransferase [Streptomyces sp. WM6378]|uniref:GNAT family N-acetyltransferase n=1 Tax=Streptomyces sp. WM6378 TaxID=1415557 RepID=UPI0006AFFF7D|nr:GNAT family N-acetyltransferase [Streptomyces sp. WM6378]KOU35537.1 acetyltransferase [Streptomyces sp. WM6378]